jgi:trimethylamine--corrinoid protein Co-methyltransferase
VNEDTLAFDVMREVIPRDGVFLGERHTVKQMRKGAIWVPGVSERVGASGDDERTGVLARARTRAREILQTHEIEPLSDDVSRRLDEIMEQARRELVGA